MAIPTGGYEGIKAGFEPLPAGVYTAKVVAGDVGTTTGGKNPGATRINWKFEITDEEYTGRNVWWNMVMVENAKGLQRMFLEGVGYSAEELDDPEFAIDVNEIEGRECKVVLKVGVNPNTDEPNNSVRRILPLDTEEAELPT